MTAPALTNIGELALINNKSIREFGWNGVDFDTS